MFPLPTPSATTPTALLQPPLSRAAVALWLRFQCNPAATLHESYREVLAASPRDRAQAGRKKDKDKDKESAQESAQESVWMQRLWGRASLSRLVCERFALRIDVFPRAPSQLPFFLRLVMLDSPLLLRLLRSAGLVLSAAEIAAVIESEQVARLKKGLGASDYTFAMTKGAGLRPSPRRVALGLSGEQKASLGDPAFHTLLGLRLLVLQSEGLQDQELQDEEGLAEQHWRRLALKCPRGIVDLLRRSSRQEFKGMEGLDEGTAAGLRATITLFETEEETGEHEKWWCALAKEVIGSWHGWLESSKVA